VTLRLAIFDCDGTLVDSQADIGAAMDGAFHAWAWCRRRAARPGVSSGFRWWRRCAVCIPGRPPRLEAAQAYKAAFRARREAGMVGEPLYDGIAALVEDLVRAAGCWAWPPARATGAGPLPATHGLARHFVTLQTADRHPSKPHPSMIEACLDATGAEPR
jgi:phosphoglycolate phosphatase